MKRPFSGFWLCTTMLATILKLLAHAHVTFFIFFYLLSFIPTEFTPYYTDIVSPSWIVQQGHLHSTEIVTAVRFF